MLADVIFGLGALATLLAILGLGAAISSQEND